ncbi:MAG: outer membrane protein assembly factor BamD [Cyclobacteriaceae bacterium]|nr:outer membrane protein assembly factor BamD [Cyclobacteriaceae bacterium]
MRNRLFFSLITLTFILTAINGCKFRKIEKNDDWRVKYEAALDYYESEDYYRASILFEQILPIVRGLPEGEKVQFYLAYCQYYQGIYLVASHYFKTFYESYGRSGLVEEARYMYAYSLYADSPETNLDQTSTHEALAALQNFLNKYPGSDFSKDTDKLILELQNKLEKKGFDNAFHYFKLNLYQAAIVAFDNFKYEYPDSKYNEDALYYKLSAQYDLAEQSIRSKQMERYNDVKNSYEEFIDKYPESDFLKQAEKIYQNVLGKVSNFATVNK